MRPFTLSILVVLAFVMGCDEEASLAKAQDASSGFNKANIPSDLAILLPRDGIMAIWDPVFVSAAEANMPDDAEVIGFVHNGEAHAYSINLLDGHEIVNDVVGGERIAATW
ncbi:MAG: DUF3179 domain-containing protein [Armatimonadetes bacterium]|nr:DUF3179 domain-containing protein [Armatimonadota bacterium]